MEILELLLAPFEVYSDLSDRGKKIFKRIVAGVVAVIIVVLTSVGIYVKHTFFPERSAATFCKAWFAEKDKYLAKYNTPSENPAEAALKMVGAVSALVPIFDRLSRVAPDEIQPDVEQIRDVTQAQLEAFSHNPLNPLVGGSKASWSGPQQLIRGATSLHTSRTTA
jgi:hypothetical protein